MHCINGLHDFNAYVSSVYHLVRTFKIKSAKLILSSLK
jgi:hypothetical protein